MKSNKHDTSRNNWAMNIYIGGERYRDRDLRVFTQKQVKNIQSKFDK